MSWRSWLFPNAVLFAGALTLAATARAQETCPPPHDDYRRPIPVWGGFGYQVNACPGDKIEVAASFLTFPAGTMNGSNRASALARAASGARLDSTLGRLRMSAGGRGERLAGPRYRAAGRETPTALLGRKEVTETKCAHRSASIIRNRIYREQIVHFLL
jgi:hypothetical protein